MSEKKKKKGFDPRDLKPEEMLKFEIAEELGLGAKVMEGGWRSLTAKESGRIGGLITKRKKEMKKEAMEKGEL
ncbi:MAG TPA: alpha/beta-type small acid-soluble spore protein [Candidatus Lachnoclostridium pullistercoris]|uniref:Alpha/beta-type small acid-soluble spore protein n=1 Tax=Candidatus Lachnoclostridium pullistercoris TaxID=2838632 RepID=A0A9D2PCL6_9FIRM|nr:alpha/beta-type small acid-soluble spore protein [Candidatus Lachnoclostridium pullistercoris]